MPVSGQHARHIRSTLFRLGLILPLLAAAASCGKSAQDYAANGDKFFQQKQYAKAIVEYQNAVKADPKAGKIRQKLADAYRETDSLPKALGRYIRAADLLPDDVPLQLVAIRAFLTSARFEDAKTRAEQVLAKDRKNATAQGLLGSALIGMRDMNGALTQIQEAIDLAPGAASMQIKMGALQVSQGDLRAAENAFLRAAALDATSVNAQLVLANFYWWTNRPEKAEAQFKLALAAGPTDATANRNAGMFYVATGRAALAEPYFIALSKSATDPADRLLLGEYYLGQDNRARAMEVLSTLQSDNNAQWRLAALYYADGKIMEAHRLIDDIVKRDPSNAGAMLVKADFLLKEGKLDEALTRAKAAVAVDPQFASAHYAVGRIYRAMNKLDEAITSFNETLRLNPRATVAEVALAQAHLHLNNSPKSAEYARDAIKSDPRRVDARITLVATLVANGRGKEAEAELKPLAAWFPDSALVQSYQGAASILNNNPGAARQAFERALLLDPACTEALAGLVSLDVSSKRIVDAMARIEKYLPSTSPAVLVLAAQVYAAARQPNKVEELLLKTIQLDSTNMRAYEMLGRYYVSVNRLDAALQQFDALAARQPQNVGTQTMVALLLAAQNKQAEAKARFEKIIELNPRAAVAANNLAWMYADGDGNLDRALDLAQTAKSVLPNEAAVDDTLGWVDDRKNLVQAAIPLLRASVDKDARQPLYHYHLGLAYAKSGDKTRARESLQEAIRLAPDFAESAEARRVLDTL